MSGENVNQIKELGDLIAAMVEQRKKIEELEKPVTEANKTLAAMEQKAASYLEELGWESFKSPFGTISVKDEWRFALPQTDEDKLAFFNYLRERGVYDKYATVHSTAYNSFCKAEWDVAKSEGRGFDFKLPGVPEPKLYRKLSLRKA